MESKRIFEKNKIMDRKQSFIRCVFGVLNPRLLKEIKVTILNKFQIPYIVYVFGEENEKILKDMKLKTVLLDKNNHPWKNEKYNCLMRPKLEAIKVGMQDNDTIVFLDWDCVQVNNVPMNIWDKMNSRGEIQACLQKTKRLECKWRRGQQHIHINTGYLYLNNKTLPQQFIDAWDANLTWHIRGNDEVPIMYVIDYNAGHIIGASEWEQKYESEHCLLPYESRNILDSKMQLKKKIVDIDKAKQLEAIKNTNIYFIHYMKAKDIKNVI